MLFRRFVATHVPPADKTRSVRRRWRSAPLAWLGPLIVVPLVLPVITAGATAPTGPPAAIPLTTAPASGWSAWIPTVGPCFLSPTLGVNPAAGALEVAGVGLDLSVSYTRVAAGTDGPPRATGRSSFLPPVILADAVGTPHLLVTGIDGMVTHSQLLNGQWSPSVPTGAVSFLPPAAALNSLDGTLELVTVGPDGEVRHSRSSGAGWSSPAVLNAVSFLPPTLVSNPGGGLELAIIGLDRQVYHARFAGNQWSAFAPTGIFTDMAPALAVATDGTVHLAASGLDRGIVHSRFANNAWSAPVSTGIQSSLSPALAFSPGDGSLLLLARGTDRSVQYGRFVAGFWTAPVSLGIVTDARPALAAAGAMAGAAVTAADGKVYVSSFGGSAAAAPGPAASPSFSKDILRILTNNGAKTCARSGCHAGASPQVGMDLEAGQAYANIVNVNSVEHRSLKRVLPGDASNSYLFMKVSGAAGVAGSRMPLAGGPLAVADIELIRQWINAGAPNN